MSCSNPLNHVECDHGGWAECSAGRTPAKVAIAARRAANHASRDLGLDTIRLRYFEPAPPFHGALLNPGKADFGMITLHVGPFDPGLLGKACHPEKTPLPTVWIRTGLSPAYTALVVLHEARHVWQMGVDRSDKSAADDEADAIEYMWKAIQTQGFSARELAGLVRDSARID